MRNIQKCSTPTLTIKLGYSCETPCFPRLYDVYFYNSTASTWTSATARTTWESIHILGVANVHVDAVVLENKTYTHTYTYCSQHTVTVVRALV